MAIPHEDAVRLRADADRRVDETAVCPVSQDFERLGFHAEALLTDWLMDRNFKKHDLVIMSHEVER